MNFNHLIESWVNTLTPQIDMTELDQKVITLVLSEPSSSWTLYFHEQRIEITDTPPHPADLVVTGNLYTLWQFMGGSDRAAVVIEGDLSLAVILQRQINPLNIDWKEWLRQQMGDFPSQLINQPFEALQSLCQPSNQTYQSLQTQIDILTERVQQLENQQS